MGEIWKSKCNAGRRVKGMAVTVISQSRRRYCSVIVGTILMPWSIVVIHCSGGDAIAGCGKWWEWKEKNKAIKGQGMLWHMSVVKECNYVGELISGVRILLFITIEVIAAIHGKEHYFGLHTSSFDSVDGAPMCLFFLICCRQVLLCIPNLIIKVSFYLLHTLKLSLNSHIIRTAHFDSPLNVFYLPYQLMSKN